MKLTATVLAVLCAAWVVLASTDAGRSTQIAPKWEMPDLSPEAQAKMMQDYMALMAPGEHHAMLEYFEGDWTTTMKIWMSGRGSGEDAMASNGKATFEKIFGGRFLRQDYQGSMMGMPYTGEGMLGYDNYAGKYFNTWISTMSTALSVSTGFAHEDGKGMTLYGEMDEPAMDLRGKLVAYVTRIVDEDTFVFEIADPHIGGDDNTVVEITYKRAD